MAILNYTTQIKAGKTVSEIQEKLVKAKAQAVMTEYNDDGIPEAISFRIMSKHGLLSFRMNVNFNGVYQAISKNPKVPKRLKTREQAARVAWRIQKDWIEVQLARIEAELAEIEEVFLPYMQNESGETLYKTLESGGFKQITMDR